MTEIPCSTGKLLVRSTRRSEWPWMDYMGLWLEGETEIGCE